MNFYNQEISSTTFDDNLYQELLTTSATKTRPLLHFCFDHLKKGSDGVVNVALTCPKVNFTGEFSKVHKCCPFGKITILPRSDQSLPSNHTFINFTSESLYIRLFIARHSRGSRYTGKLSFQRISIEFLDNFA